MQSNQTNVCSNSSHLLILYCSALVKDEEIYTDPKKTNDVRLNHFQSVFSSSSDSDLNRDTELVICLQTCKPWSDRHLSDVNEIYSYLTNNNAFIGILLFAVRYDFFSLLKVVRWHIFANIYAIWTLLDSCHFG